MTRIIGNKTWRDSNIICNHYFSKKVISHIGDLFENNKIMKLWEDLKAKYDLDDYKSFYFDTNCKGSS